MSKRTNTHVSISNAVMQDIETGKVDMRPRTYFVLLSGLAAAAVVSAGVATAYLTSIAYFWLRIVNSDRMAYGARARLSDELASFPWWLLVLAVVLGMAAVLLVRRQGHLYRHRMSTIALLIVLASLLIGIVFASFNIGQPYAQNHAPMMQQRGQGSGRHIQK